MNPGIKRTLMACVAGLVACLVLPGVLKAASFTIDDTTSSIAINVGQFEGGFSVNGTQIQAPSNSLTGSTTVDETGGSGSFTFSGTWIDTNGANETGQFFVLFTEGNTNQISDIFQYTVSFDSGTGLTTIAGSFQSSDSVFGAVAFPKGGSIIFFNENNGNYDFSLTDLTGLVASTTSPVPEPNTAALLGAGFLGLLGISLVPRLRKSTSA